MWRMESRTGCMASLSRLTARKQRLLACACVRRVEGLLSAPALRAVIDASEAFADGRLTLDELEAAYRAAAGASDALPYASPVYLAAWAATRTATHPPYCNLPFSYHETLHLSQLVAEALIPGEGPGDPRVADVRQAEVDTHQRLLEDIELPVAFDPAWRTEYTVGIASKMYQERDFAAMPILADALEEAGCDNADILVHCREPGVHVRGCWIVDLLLEKE
jgi:hypothetical protein